MLISSCFEILLRLRKSCVVMAVDVNAHGDAVLCLQHHSPAAMEYWLISAPGEKTCQQTWESLQNVTTKQGDLSTNWKFHIPDLKVSRPNCIPLQLDCICLHDNFEDGYRLPNVYTVLMSAEQDQCI